MPNIYRQPLVAHLLNGKETAYYDSGPVEDSTSFTTLILIHGCHFNSRGFLHLLTLASRFNLRLVLVVRQEYDGSSNYTDEEISILCSDNPDPFLCGAGVLLADFVLYLVTNTDVCKASEDRSSGGIVIAGWSLGCVFAQTLLYEKTPLDDRTYAAIEPYILSLTLIDPPHCAFGIPIPSAYDQLFYPLSINDPEESKQKFRRWVSSYFDHDIQPDGDTHRLDPRMETEKCVFNSWTPTMQEEMTEDFPFRSDVPIMKSPLIQSHIKAMSENVLFISNPRRFPRVHVTYVHGERSVWPCAVTRHINKRKYSQLSSRSHEESIRSVRFIDLKEGNHFIHTDFPELFMETMIDSLYQKI